MATEQEKQWTILALQEWCTSYLKEKGFESARLTTDLLLSHSLKYERIQLYANYDKPLSSAELERFRELFKRRLNHEPVQYITGEAFFMGFSFYVDNRVLVPRPETELLVLEAVDILKSQPEKQYTALDIGTGSGNIAISLAHFAKNIEIDAIDISPDALAVAGKNIEKHNVGERVHLINADVFQLPDGVLKEQYDIIISNPPYISNEEYALLSKDVKEFEPALALNDKADGLTFYKTIAERGNAMLAPGGWLLVEIAYNQGYDVTSLFTNAGYANVTLIPDLENIPRIVKARKEA